MNDIIIQRDAVNLEALDADLRAALGDGVSGVSFTSGSVTVHLADKAAVNASDTARQIVQAHDPSKLTPDQQAELDRAAQLEQMRQTYGAAALDLTAFDGQPVLIQQLAQKIAWLELEIVELRGGKQV